MLFRTRYYVIFITKKQVKGKSADALLNFNSSGSYIGLSY